MVLYLSIWIKWRLINKLKYLGIPKLMGSFNTTPHNRIVITYVIMLLVTQVIWFIGCYVSLLVVTQVIWFIGCYVSLLVVTQVIWFIGCYVSLLVVTQVVKFLYANVQTTYKNHL